MRPTFRFGKDGCVAGIGLVLAVGLASVTARAASPARDGIEFFEKKVRPVLVEKCQKCHGARLQKGSLRLDSREAALKGGESGPVIVAGHPEKSELVRAINYEADGFQMPPTGKLDAGTIGDLTEWIRRGAPWPESPAHEPSGGGGPASKFDFAARAKHWSFQPLTVSRPPATGRADGFGSGNAIDAFIAERLQRAGLKPAPAADRRSWLRRVTFDLTGLPPTPAEIHQFLADRSPAACERVVDRLLASPHYGVRWGRHWLDLVRFAESYGHEFDFEIRAAWPYRDYVVRAFNDDLPYDQFVSEQIAGDRLPAPRRRLVEKTNESIVGTGFWCFGQAKQAPVDVRAEECDAIDNQLDVFGKAFLGLTIACARCHDHKFDPIRAQDYYALAGFLRSSRRQTAFLDDPRPIEEFASRRRASATECVGLAADALLARGPKSWLPAPGRAGDSLDWTQILLPWRRLAGLPAGRLFVEARLQLARDFHQRDADSRQEQGRKRFEDFREPRFGSWRAFGPAFGTQPSRAGDFVLGGDSERPFVEFAVHRAAHSGLIAPEFRGTIESPSFTIEKPFIHYHASRHRAGHQRRRELKAGQLNLIVDGFQVVREPLYGHLSLSVANDGPAAWYTQDVGKLKGEKAYIEIVDEDDGWIVVDSIVFSDERFPPSPRPNRLLARLLDDSSIDSPARLADAYGKLLAETLTLWRSGRLADDPFAADRVGVLEWLFRSPLNVTDPTAARRIAGLLSQTRRQAASLRPGRRAVALADGTAENEHVLVRGNHRKPAEEIPRRFLEVFGAHAIPSAETGSGRLQLARDVTGPAAALLARVLVNRLWQAHFGRGLVASADNFGKLGEAPSHPELLDYLAAELIRSRWSIKHVERELVLSSTYGMSSRPSDSKPLAVDPDNRLLSRMPVKRLEGEEIRDAILAVSGRLNERMEGPSVPVHLDEFMTGRGRPAISGPLDGDGRRSIYLAVRRNFLTPMFLAFDYPTPFTTAGRRGTSNVPAQALTLLNNPFVAQQASQWAAHLAATTDRESTMIGRLYESAFGREPTTAEAEAAREFLASQHDDRGSTGPAAAWSDLCHVLFNVKEFIYIE